MKIAIALAILILAAGHGPAFGQPVDERKAGYAWAEENDIDDVADCEDQGDSDAFVSGCRDFVGNKDADENPSDSYESEGDESDDESHDE
jgi:hypothetical protein